MRILEEASMDNIEQLAEAIKKIIELKGADVFEKPILFCTMLDDLVPGLTKEKFFVEY